MNGFILYHYIYIREKRCLAAFFWLAALFFAIDAGELAADQPWKMFAEQIRQEKAAQNSKQTDFDSSEPAVPPPPPSRPAPQIETSTAPTPMNRSHEAAAEKTSGGLLDFSETLGPDASVENAVAGPNEDDSPEAERLALPSYRNRPRLQNDATLHDICFPTPENGWAVGDRAAVWTTLDGGQSWLLADVPTDRSLRAIRFFDAQHGLIVGGDILPGGENGRGIVLRTDDGGRSWSEVPTASFPILRDLQIIDAQTALASGDSSELYPAGIFLSLDGGQTWNAATNAERHAGWKKLLYDTQNQRGVGIGGDGSLQNIVKSRCRPNPLLSDTQSATDLTDDGSRRWLVGQQCLILCSDDGGQTWQRPNGTIRAAAHDVFDFETVFASGDKIAIAGSPGSLVFLSDDGGRTWTDAPTGITVPIRKIFFSDPQHGWAVGELGTVIATDDGGATWHVRHEGGRRLAFLGLCAEATDLPPEFFARIGAEGGYLGRTAVFVLPEKNEESNPEITPNERIDAATIVSGGCGGGFFGNFRTGPKSLNLSFDAIMERFEQENDGQGTVRFRESLVRLIRTYRPSILVIRDAAEPHAADTKLQTEEGSPLEKIAEHARTLGESPQNPILAFLEHELPLAIQSANDPNVWPEHLDCGLAPWQVEKVHAVLSPPDEGNILFPADDYSPTLGRSLAEIADDARRLLGTADSPTAAFTRVRLTTLYDRTDAESKFPTLFAHLDLPVGGEARRLPETDLPPMPFDPQRRAAERRAAFQTLDAAAKRPSDSALERLLAGVEGQRRAFDPELAADYLTQTGRKLVEAGKWDLAESVFSIVAQNYPDLPAARESLVWLIQFYAGGEPFWQTQDNNRFRSSEGTPNQAAEKSQLAVDPSQTQSRFHNADALGKLIRQYHPQLYMNPEIRFPLAIVQRRRGYDNDALRYYMNRSLVSSDDLWGARAKAEYQLLTPNRAERSPEEQLCPLSIGFCRVAPNRPFLDGVLESEIWNAAARFSLSERPEKAPPSDENDAERKRRDEREKLSTEFGTFISLLYDSQFLYLGIECRKVPNVPYPKIDLPRQRDTQATTEDRVEIQLDLDRDYTTFYRFVFDRRGQVDDACWNRSDWNARIFSAQHETENQWTLEIALPWEEIAERPPTKTDVWAASFRRIVPNVGFECWNVERSEATRNAFGLLFFGNR